MYRKLTGILLLAAFALSGCAAALIAGGAAAGAGGALYVSGDLEKEYAVSSSMLWNAVQDGAEAMNFRVTEKSIKDKRNVLVCRDKDNRRIKMTVYPLTGERSKISIRVDTFGDEEYSRKILDQVESEL
jgi:hypothetical protein